MGCCEATNPELSGAVSNARPGPGWEWPVTDSTLDRRAAVKGMLAAAGALAIGSCGPTVQAGLPRHRRLSSGNIVRWNMSGAYIGVNIWDTNTQRILTNIAAFAN